MEMHAYYEFKLLLEYNIVELEFELKMANVSFKKFSSGSRVLDDILGSKRTGSNHGGFVSNENAFNFKE